jgi:hypothetical protein
MRIAALLLRHWARTESKALDLAGELIYADDGNHELLISDRYQLVGKPDYILDVAGQLMPVERKSRPLPAAGPYKSEMLQMAAYVCS